MSEMDWSKSGYSNAMSGQISSFKFHLNGPLIFSVESAVSFHCWCAWRCKHCKGRAFSLRKSDERPQRIVCGAHITHFDRKHCLFEINVWAYSRFSWSQRGCRTLPRNGYEVKWKHHLFAIRHSNVISCLQFFFLVRFVFEATKLENSKKNKHTRIQRRKIDELLQSNNPSKGWRVQIRSQWMIASIDVHIFSGFISLSLTVCLCVLCLPFFSSLFSIVGCFVITFVFLASHTF